MLPAPLAVPGCSLPELGTSIGDTGWLDAGLASHAGGFVVGTEWEERGRCEGDMNGGDLAVHGYFERRAAVLSLSQELRRQVELERGRKRGTARTLPVIDHRR